MIVPINLTSTKAQNYDIVIDTLPTLFFDTKVIIVTNPTVAHYHLDMLLEKITAKSLHVVTVRDGEKFKTLETLDDILVECFEHKLDRKSLLIAFGGGVIGDMTGFAASIYQRGIDFIQIPTTLLSQVDASVGGKTAVNSSYGKNLIGTFHQPQAVYIDPAFLMTLPVREFSSGLAEVIKMAVMFDKEFFTFLKTIDLSKEENIKKLISRSIEIKASVVSQDEREEGIRAVLNYGHTFGHVIEKETNYRKYLHGEAVALGMVMANALAVELGIFSAQEAQEVKDFLALASLPTEYVIKDVDAFYEHFLLDKKTADDSITFILPEGMGDYRIVSDIDEAIVKNVLYNFGELICS